MPLIAAENRDFIVSNPTGMPIERFANEATV